MKPAHHSIAMHALNLMVLVACATVPSPDLFPEIVIRGDESQLSERVHAAETETNAENKQKMVESAGKALMLAAADQRGCDPRIASILISLSPPMEPTEDATIAEAQIKCPVFMNYLVKQTSQERLLNFAPVLREAFLEHVKKTETQYGHRPARAGDAPEPPSHIDRLLEDRSTLADEAAVFNTVYKRLSDSCSLVAMGCAEAKAYKDIIDGWRNEYSFAIQDMKSQPMWTPESEPLLLFVHLKYSSLVPEAREAMETLGAKQRRR